MKFTKSKNNITDSPAISGNLFLFLFFIFFLIFLTGISLSPLSAQTPMAATAYRWFQIETEHYQIIFPEELTAQAQRMANTLEHLYPYHHDTLHPKREFKFPVILSPNGYANGFVASSPRRSVYFNYPGNFTSDDWLSLLAVHEGRHIVQYNTINQSTTNFLSVLLGEYGLAPGIVTASSRLLEGDAVTAETVFSNGGRGRSPEFTMLMKALLIEENEPGFATINHGSYKRELPNQYVFGYLLSVYMRNKYGKEITDEMLSASAKYPFGVIWAFRKIKTDSPEKAITDSDNNTNNTNDTEDPNKQKSKKSKGKTLDTIYKEMCNEYRSFYQNQISQINETPVDPLSSPLPGPISEKFTRRPGFREYRSPHPTEEGVLVFKRTLNNYQTGIYLISEKEINKDQSKITEKKIKEISSVNDISVSGSLIAWAELKSDNTYTDRVFSDIRLYNYKTKKGKKLTNEGFYFLPSLSSDGKTIIAVNRDISSPTRQTENQGAEKESLSLFNTEGHLLQTIPLPVNGSSGKPVFTSGDTEISVVITGIGKREIYSYNLALSQWRRRLSVQGEYIRQLAPMGNSILYTSNYSGIDNIYVLDPDNSRWRLTSRKYGAFYPRFDNTKNRLIFADFTASNGYDIVSIPADRLKREALAAVPVFREDFFAPLLKQETGAFALIEEKIPDKEYPVSPYKRAANLFNLHSWAPVDVDLLLNNQPTPRVGFFGYSNDIFMSTYQKMSVFYDFENRGFGTGYLFQINEIKPNISIEGETLFLHNDKVVNKNYTAATLGLELPFSYTWNSESTTLSSRIGASITGAALTDLTVSPEEAANSVRYSMPLSYYGYVFWGRHFRSDGNGDTTFPLSLRLGTRFTHEPIMTERGTTFTLSSDQNLPGIIPGATFEFTETYTLQDRSASSSPFIRGSKAGNSYESLLLSAEYNFTIFNPDLPILGLIGSWKRLRGGVFYDGLIVFRENPGDSPDVTRDDFSQSVGAELLFDMTFLEAGSDLSFGVEFSWLIEEERPVFRFTIGESAVY